MARFLGFYCIHQYSSSWFSCACPVLLQQVWLGMGTFLRRSKHWIRTEDPLLYETTIPVFCSCCHCHYLYLWYYYISVEIKRPGEMIPVIVSPGFFYSCSLNIFHGSPLIELPLISFCSNRYFFLFLLSLILQKQPSCAMHPQ